MFSWFKSFFKKKQVEQPDPQMMIAFHQNGGYQKNLDVMAWQLGWIFGEIKKGEPPEPTFNKLYYGGGSPFPFDEKTFKIAWNCVQNKQ